MQTSMARPPAPASADAFHQLVHHLVADGDRRARLGGRRARRVLTDMTAPGYTRPPLLTRDDTVADATKGR